ncbi:MAG: hypothetical protein D3923_09510 [Candidatus Electrothrix sp. AR3]|nr:hypothetical protein [Candidatus Electrothrix sp. AR3]
MASLRRCISYRPERDSRFQSLVCSNVCLAEAPGNVVLTRKISKLSKKSVVNVSQLITLDKALCTEKIHALPSKVMDEIDNGMRLVLKL